MIRENGTEEMLDIDYRFADGTQIPIFENLSLTFESVKNPFVEGTFFSRVKLDFFDTFDESLSPGKSVDLSIDPLKTLEIDLEVETSSVPCTRVLNLKEREDLVKLLQKERPQTLHDARNTVKQFTDNI